VDTGARFGWTELCATDTDEAARFFARFLGWERSTQALAQKGQPIEYSLFSLGGRTAAGMYPMVGAQRKRGMPSQWLSYLFVPDLDAAVARAQGLGAAVLAQPLEVFDLGRMALLRDPQGALFGLWQARRLGADFQTRDELGHVAWFEHVSTDATAAARFYADLCGWSTRAPQRPAERVLLEQAGVPVAGVSPVFGGLTPQWLTFVRVTDCEAACRRIEELRGAVVVPARAEALLGMIALARDPQGACFGLLARVGGG
jgi:hypothetical protein